MMRAIGDQVAKNPEYLSILDKKAIKNVKIDDKTQVEQVSVMNKLLNDALRAKGYAGPDIKMVLTDVTDPKGPYYTDTLTNTVVFDRKMLASANRDQILNALGHEFGHYSKEDDKDKSQDIANHTGELLENRTKGMVAKEATEETLVAIRNNKNVITGEEGKKLAESIPMDRREYYKALMFNISVTKLIVGAGAEIGVIYNKDPITGKEEFGYVWGGKGLAGFDYKLKNMTPDKIILNREWGFEVHEKEGKPIKKFQGMTAKIEGSIGAFGVGVSGEIDTKNDDKMSDSVGAADTGVKVMVSLGYRRVDEFENPSEELKEAIRIVTNNSEKIAETTEGIRMIIDAIKKAEELKK